MGETDSSLEEDVLLRSPMEIESQQDPVLSGSDAKVCILN